MESHDRWSPVDCPACGSTAETCDALAADTDDGLDLLCACGLRIIAGIIVARGIERSQDDIADGMWPWPASPTAPAYRAPGERRHALRLVAAHSAGGDATVETTTAWPAFKPALAPITSVTIRFNRARQAPDTAR
jgi:hypothetical protein